MNTDEPMAPGEIGRLFEQVNKQLDRVLDQLQTMRIDYQAAVASVENRINSLDSKYVTRTDLEMEKQVSRANRQAWERQQDLVTKALEDDYVRLDKELQAIEVRRQALEDQTTQRRQQYKLTMVGQFAWPLLVVIAGAFLIGVLHL